ncbi:MAG: hypothetical protein IE927_09225, partial [Rhodobacterales bacterium]|nr:hypothetical protein [Rhodobacterales bacterium]
MRTGLLALMAAALAGCAPAPRHDPCAGFSPIRLTAQARASLSPAALQELDRWNASLLRDCGIGAARPAP